VELDLVVLNTTFGLVWFGFLFFCLIVVAFDVKLSKIMVLIFAIIGIVFVIIYITQLSPMALMQWVVSRGLDRPELALSTLFYFIIFLILTFILLGIYLGAKTDYIRIEQNEVWCVRGITGKSRERFPTRSMEVNVERHDIFEYALGTGTITLKIPSLNKFIQLDTVFKAGKKHERINKLLSDISVKPVTPG